MRTAEPSERAPTGALANKTFVLTGSLGSWTREEARRLIEAQGGRVANAVSRRTDYLRVGDAPGHKLADARRLGVRTIGESAFRRLAGITRDGERSPSLCLQGAAAPG